MINSEIKKGEWYKIILDDGECVGKCFKELFVDGREEILEMSVLKDDKIDFYDLRIQTEKIKEIKLLETKKISGNKVYEIQHDKSDGGIIKFNIFSYDKSVVDQIAKELISSKKRVETFEDIEKAVEFLERLT